LSMILSENRSPLFGIMLSTAGVRWDDPVFGIAWPDSNPILNDRDRCYPDFTA